MDVDYLHISAFTATPGQGNSAAVCHFASWPEDDELSRIAQKIALPVTACIVHVGDRTELRWLSRAGTYIQSMCGHGTLAASCVMAMDHPELREFSFSTPGGTVPVRCQGNLFYLGLPKWNSQHVSSAPGVAEALGRQPLEFREAGRDLMAIYASEEEVKDLNPDMAKLRALARKGYIATAPGLEFDCVSRFFCPAFGIGVDEDPVTGSAHCSIAPFWAERLQKTRLRAWQASAAGGELQCEVTPDAVVIGASAVLFGRGRVSV